MVEHGLKSEQESWDWLTHRLTQLEIKSLEELSTLCGVNKGTLSKYFHQRQKPTIGVLPQLCEALQVSPNTLLVALGVFPDQTTKK